MKLRHRLRALLALGLLAALGLVMAGCPEEEVEALNPVFEVRIQDDGLRPSEVRLQVPDQIAVTVRNQTDQGCRFHFGPWLRGLDVPAQSEADMAFMVVDPDLEEVAMFCEDRQELRGQIEVIRAPAR